jgi:hypothetical protein
MGGRGTFAIGNIVAYTYSTTGKIEGVKVLTGLNGKHGLPEEAHSSYAYIKLKPDGTFHEMRIYDKDHYLKYEIAYHSEPSIDSSRKPVLHYHTYGRDFSRSKARKMPKAMKKHFRKYLKGVPL